MNITILSDATMAPAFAAWDASRNKDEPVTNAIFSIDASVNEMPIVLLAFEDFMILEREIFFTARNHVAWARTSRVDDVTKFRVPDEMKMKIHDHYRNLMERARDSGIAQDQYRMALPLVALTSWTARMSYRDIVKMHKYFFYLAGHVADQLKPRFARIARRLYEIVLSFVDTRKPLQVANEAIEKFKLVKYLHEGFGFIHGPMKNDAMTSICASIPIALRAQIVRHREIIVSDTFFASVLQVPDFPKLTLESSVLISCTASNDVWKSVLDKRTCWIAQTDLWKPIVQMFGPSQLPCEDGQCPYEVDARARLTPGKDPNPPCPRFCNLHGISKAPWANAMLDQIKSGAKSQKWLEEIR